MNASPRPLRMSLRTRVVLIGGLLGLMLLAGSLVFLRSTVLTREELGAETEAFLQEQLIANRITQGVMRQLATASAFSESATADLASDFQEAGDDVYGQIRRYLFFELSPDARIEIERMREEHQELEVLAARTRELYERGEIELAESSRAALVEQAFALLDAVESFVLLRDDELEAVRERQSAAFDRLFLLGIVGSILIGITALLLAIMLHRRVARPLHRMAEATEELAAGNLGVRIPLDGDRELERLSTGFNRMAASLQTATRQLEDRNRELSDALEHIRETRDELVQTEKLSAMGRMAAGLAHELNNPLASVLGFGELLRDRLRSDPGSHGEELDREFVDPIVDEAARAQQLIRNFLHFSRRSSSELGPVPLREPLERVIAMREYSFRQAGLTLVLQDIPDVHVHADLHMLQSVILNLVNNAFQALIETSEPEGRGLTIRGETRNGRAHLVFDDDGPGLPDPSRIFEPFFTTKPPGEGTGLGLAVAHRFMEAFGGRITGENRAAGGARLALEFAVVVPVDSGTTGPESSSQPDHASEGPLPRGLRVLVVEDEEPLRRLQQRILERIDAEVLTASEGAEARQLLERHEVDLVVSDVRMPGESGLDLYRWIRSERPELARRFLFVTGDIGAPELAALAERRPGYLLHKPFEIEEYLTRIRMVMRRGSTDGAGPGDPPFRSHSAESPTRSGAPGAVSGKPGSAPENS